MTSATIVYVDDDADDRNFLKEAFEEQQYPLVKYFEDAPSALSFLMSLPDALLPKLLITDINMPVMTGIELLYILKKNKRFAAIKLIALSTANQLEYQAECNRLGTAFLQKPNSFSELRQIANHFMFQ